MISKIKKKWGLYIWSHNLITVKTKQMENQQTYCDLIQSLPLNNFFMRCDIEDLNSDIPLDTNF